MYLRKLCLLIAVICAMVAAKADVGGAPDIKAELAERLHRAETMTSLDREGLNPWHLKLEVQLFDLHGTPTEKGTIEEWWAGPKMRLIVYSVPSYSAKVLENADGTFRTKQTGSPPRELTLLLDQVVHPMPSAKEIDESKPELRKQNFGKLPLECIMLSRSLKPSAESAGYLDPIPFGLFPTYCFDVGKDALRAAYNFVSEEVIRNGLGMFQNVVVARELTVHGGTFEEASGHLASLSTMKVDPSQFVKTDDLESFKAAARVSGGVIAGTILQKVQPVYPEISRQRHVSGTVVLHALIGRDGHVHSLHLISAPDTNLAISALFAVRQWVYKPYQLNGEAVDVDTTITVNYNFGT